MIVYYSTFPPNKTLKKYLTFSDFPEKAENILSKEADQMQTQINITTCLYVYAESTNPAVFRNLFGASIHLDLLSIHLNVQGKSMSNYYQKPFITLHFISYPGQTAFLLTGSPGMESPFIPCGPGGP